jgi:hypothetical protein
VPLPNRNAPLQKEGAHLIDDTGALADQPLTYSMQGLQVELIGGLRCSRTGDCCRCRELCKDYP